jgi:hypothetical protein
MQPITQLKLSWLDIFALFPNNQVSQPLCQNALPKKVYLATTLQILHFNLEGTDRWICSLS